MIGHPDRWQWACSITTVEVLMRSEDKAEDVQIEWPEAEVYSNN